MATRHVQSQPRGLDSPRERSERLSECVTFTFRGKSYSPEELQALYGCVIAIQISPTFITEVRPIAVTDAAALAQAIGKPVAIPFPLGSSFTTQALAAIFGVTERRIRVESWKNKSKLGPPMYRKLGSTRRYYRRVYSAADVDFFRVLFPVYLRPTTIRVPKPKITVSTCDTMKPLRPHTDYSCNVSVRVT